MTRAERMALRKAQYAELMDHFRWLPEQIARLTPRQISEYCFHAREEGGGIKRPKPKQAPPLTEEAHVARFLATAPAMGYRDPKKIAAKVAEIRAYYARKRGESNGDRPANPG